MGYYPEEEEFQDPVMELVAMLNRGGMRGGRNQKEGVYSYQDQTQVPYDDYNALNRAMNLTGVDLSAYTNSGYATADPFSYDEYVPSSAVYAARNDFTGRVLAAAMADLEGGDDPQTVAAGVQQAVAASGDEEFDNEEFTEAFSRAVSGHAGRNQAMTAYNSKYGEGAADRSLAGEQVQYEVPVAEGLEPGPLGYESATARAPSPKDIIAAMQADGDFRTTGVYDTKQGSTSSLRSAERDVMSKPASEPQRFSQPQTRGTQGGYDPVTGQYVMPDYSQPARPQSPQGKMSGQKAEYSSVLQRPTAASGNVKMKRTVQDDLKRYMVERALNLAHEQASREQVPTRAQRSLDQRSQAASAMLGRQAAPRQQARAPQQSILKMLLARKESDNIY
jgi:hypothetical protein